MILGMNHWHFGYEQIVQDCRNEDGSVLMLCNADVDAMASARILSYLLRSDGIPYQLYPCTNYQALEQYLKTNESVLEEVEAIVMLNFGASKNLNRLFDSQLLTQDLKVYVMDCRKPVHLANIYAGENIVIFMDDTTKMDELPSDGDNLSGGESSSSEEESSDEDDDDDDSDSEMDDSHADDGEEEADFDDVEGETTEAIPQQDPAYDGGNESDNDEHDNDDDDDDDPATSKRRSREDQEMDPASPDSTSKRQKTTEDDATAVETDEDSQRNSQETASPSQEEVLDPRELHRKRLDRLRTYYSSGSFFGCPSAFVAYRLAAQLRFGGEKDLLWLACVGITDAYLHARLDLSGFTALSMDLKESVNRLFPNDMYEQVSNTVYAEDLLGTTPVEGDDARTRISLSDNGRIIAQNDFRFFLLRQSSLLESMIHSEYISAKFQVWTKKGMQRLQELLAKMGYPLEECKQPFHMMKPSLKRQLQHKLVENGPEYELTNWRFTSFFRITGYQSLLSASDTSYAVTALLECETPASKALEADPNSHDYDEEKMMVEAFNIAYDALNCNTTPNSANGSSSWNGVFAEGRDTSTLVNGGSLSGSTGLGAGLRMAMNLQRLVINTAVSLVDREAVTRLRHFRYAYLNCTSAGENKTARSDLVTSSSKNNKSSKDDENKHHQFAKPLALTRLAHYLMDMHRENGKWTGNKSRPLVLLAEKPRTGTYLVVGYEYPQKSGTFVKNRFGNNFELTAKSMNGTFRFDSFDSNVVEVNGDDVQRFIEQLHYLMDSI
ncbi:MAG: hypothetical protein SGBAC_000819 [Bacillariaceae sp.]